MRKYIDDDQIPKEFGGSSPYALGEHPYEKDLGDLVESSINNVDDGEDDEYLLGQPVYTNGFANINEQHKTQVETIPQAPSQDDKMYNDLENGHHEIAQLMSSDSDELQFRTHRSALEPFYDDSGYARRQSITLRYGCKTKYQTDEYVFMMISAIHCVWCAAQGSLETIVPVWLLSPVSFGGLGYEPRRSGLTLFIASMMVMMLLRSKVAKSFIVIPTNSPMRGYRIGVGSQVCLLLILPFVPFISNADNLLVVMTNILLGACILIASILGRLSSAKLHSIASSAYVEKVSLRCDTRTSLGRTLNMIAGFVQKGGLTHLLGVCGEIVGALAVAPIFVWSARTDHLFPLDASFSLYTGAMLCSVLYLVSFLLKVTSEHSSYQGDERTPQSQSLTKASILREVVEASKTDMASLFEESNWPSSTSTGGRQIHVSRSQEDPKSSLKKG
eukprot:CAMPEP_0197236062 /NCGR_PEP_ID=MMETSP1429-20130617/3328_1 /TAXON_ID=49237 /ORGANISM="Chaetoceros  sp., Strain UNC1202" /LENGTH=444 /DNA_ID=CAMNT_0042694807 /DNA_START=60 /DNA_END=1394 /DNA_ORIENTATION=-